LWSSWIGFQAWSAVPLQTWVATGSPALKPVGCRHRWLALALTRKIGSRTVFARARVGARATSAAGSITQAENSRASAWNGMERRRDEDCISQIITKGA
jgi:hypothetical protein